MKKAQVLGSPSAEKEDDYDPWRAKEDLRILLEADRIKKDDCRLRYAKRAAKEQIAENKAIEALSK
ncbi:MAG: hypothetical protein ACK5A0_15385 [Polaromonas sp.]|jgi:hypothetical protein